MLNIFHHSQSPKLNQGLTALFHFTFPKQMNSFQPKNFSNAMGLATNANTWQADKPTKRVSFSKMSLMILVQPKTADELRETWYTPKDIVAFRRDKQAHSSQVIESGGAKFVEHLIRYIVQGKPFTAVEESSLCLGHFCGLESALVHQVGKFLLSARAATRKLVLREQTCQRTMDENNIESLAHVSVQATMFAQDWASMTAMINEMTERH